MLWQKFLSHFSRKPYQVEYFCAFLSHLFWSNSPSVREIAYQDFIKFIKILKFHADLFPRQLPTFSTNFHAITHKRGSVQKCMKNSTNKV